MPEVGCFNSPEPNAFATGASRNKALVAVSSGLMNRMSRDEVEAVLGHEVTHVANGDMVTLTLIQGVVNTFVFVFARVIGNIIDKTVFGNRDRGPGLGFFLGTMVAQVVLSFLAGDQFRPFQEGANFWSPTRLVWQPETKCRIWPFGPSTVR